MVLRSHWLLVLRQRHFVVEIKYPESRMPCRLFGLVVWYHNQFSLLINRSLIITVICEYIHMMFQFGEIIALVSFEVAVFLLMGDVNILQQLKLAYLFCFVSFCF